MPGWAGQGDQANERKAGSGSGVAGGWLAAAWLLS